MLKPKPDSTNTALDADDTPEPIGRYPWIALGVVLIGTFMVILDTTIVNVALPDIGRDLQVDSGLDWVVTGYLLAVGMVQPASGWLADRFGSKRVFTVSLGLFGLASALIAVSPTLGYVIAFRVLQGLGGGAMMPVGLAMIVTLFPADRRGTAMGIWGIAAMAAPALGPVLGGYLATTASWRLVFTINIPIGILGVFAALHFLRDSGVRDRRRLDVAGLGLAAVGLTALLIAVSEATPPPWESLPMSLAAVIGLGLLVAFVRHERTTDEPLIDMAMFGITTFSLTIGIVWLLTVAQFARLVLIPLELQTVRGLSAFQTGLVLSPAAIGTALTMPVGGRLADRIGPRTPVTIGLVLVTVAALALANLTTATPLPLITAILAFQGLGFGLAIMPNTVAAMNAVPERLVNQASAVRSVNRQIAGAISVAILLTIVAATVGSLADPTTSPAVTQAAYNRAYLLAVGAAVLATVLATRLPGREGIKQILADRAAEQAERQMLQRDQEVTHGSARR